MKVIQLRSRRGGFGKDGHPALKCHPDGSIQANTFGPAKEWESWKLHVIQDDDGVSMIALESWNGKFLSAKPDGSVRADCDHIGGWEKWSLVTRHDNFVALKSHHGKYLCCDDFFHCGKSVRADRNRIQEWEEWAIVDAPRAFANPGIMQVVHLRSRRGGFGKDGHPALKCHPDGSIQANTFGPAKEWESWKPHVIPEDDNGSMIALESWNGKFLSAKPDGSVRADCDHIGGWEKWRVEYTDESSVVAFKSHHGKYLCCDDFFHCGKSVRADRHRVQEWEKWAIVHDPHALTNPGQTLQRAIGGSLLGLGRALSLFFFAIPILGFGMEGVLFGSAAAAIQSAVYGGATGGVFAILQSAGATLAWVPVVSGGMATASAGAVLLCASKDDE